jgi:hypothetical protein
MPLSAAKIEDNTIKLTSFIFFYLLLTPSNYRAGEACETLIKLLQLFQKMQESVIEFVKSASRNHLGGI